MKTARVLLCLLLLASLAAAGCRTVEGFGEDMEAGGRKLSQKSREHQD